MKQHRKLSTPWFYCNFPNQPFPFLGEGKNHQKVLLPNPIGNQNLQNLVMPLTHLEKKLIVDHQLPLFKVIIIQLFIMYLHHRNHSYSSWFLSFSGWNTYLSSKDLGFKLLYLIFQKNLINLQRYNNHQHLPLQVQAPHPPRVPKREHAPNHL